MATHPTYIYTVTPIIVVYTDFEDANSAPPPTREIENNHASSPHPYHALTTPIIAAIPRP